MMKEKRNNLIMFPQGGSNPPASPSVDRSEVIHDLLCIANYLEASAASTPYPDWMRCMAEEARYVVADLRDTG